MTKSRRTARGSSSPLRRAEARLQKVSLRYPEVVEEHPWGERAMKVRGKVFVFLSLDGDLLRMSCKLPDSNMAALMFPFTAPTGYGLGRSGWVTATFEKGDDVPLEILESWIDESYRAIAPRTVVRQLDGATTKSGRPAPKK